VVVDMAVLIILHDVVDKVDTTIVLDEIDNPIILEAVVCLRVLVEAYSVDIPIIELEMVDTVNVHPDNDEADTLDT
jgi:hypothetical protein